jgi:hypothetical protein
VLIAKFTVNPITSTLEGGIMRFESLGAGEIVEGVRLGGCQPSQHEPGAVISSVLMSGLLQQADGLVSLSRLEGYFGGFEGFSVCGWHEMGIGTYPPATWKGESVGDELRRNWEFVGDCMRWVLGPTPQPPSDLV